MLNDGNAFSVIHIATSHTGGAGLAARRLNAELNFTGVPSSFYALAKKGFNPVENEYGLNRTPHQRIASRMSRILSDLLTNESFFSISSAPGVSTSWLIKKVREENAVLHIHNWFNLLTNRQFKRLVSSGIPIVITLHDQRFMTGGCHTALACTNFLEGCISCPRVPKLLELKVRRNNLFFSHLFKEFVSNVRIIAPSKFIHGEAKQSNLLQTQEIVFVPNVLSSDYLRGIKKSDRTIPSGEIALGIASLNNNDWLKGSDIVESLMNHYNNDLEVSFKFLTNFMPSGEELFWNSINCLLVPSRGDNSPNVIHEAKIRGIPVIASEVGGITELLTDNFDVAVESQNLNLKGFVQAIELMRKREIGMTEKEIMEDSFKAYTSRSLDILVKIYKELLL
jgi:glycosyltransferase involved in cell wall biosynthesis